MGEGASSEVAGRDQDAVLKHSLLKQSRALALAERYPHSSEVLRFIASLSMFSGDLVELQEFVTLHGPAPLSACPLDSVELEAAQRDYLAGHNLESPASFYARVLLRQNPPAVAGAHSNRCPQCGQPPQCGVLRPEGHGAALSLVCSLCENEWRWPRDTCPQCAETSTEKISHHTAEQIPHLVTQSCDSCRVYLHLVNLTKDPAAIASIDELAALPLDLWAREQGYRKIHPNLAGL